MADHYNFILWFLSSSSSVFFYSSPNLSCRRLDVYHTSTYDVALERIQDAGVKCAARGSLKIQDAKMMQKISSTCLHNMVNFSLLAAEIVSLVWGIPVNFNSFHVLAALLHGSQVVSISQTLRR